MNEEKKTREFQKECFLNYVDSLQKEMPNFPKPYLYPDGNPIKPVLPVQIAVNKIMVVGAFPSARFEKRNNKLIPIGDNLAPFGPEKYFDGQEIRIQESTDSLYKNYFDPLGLNVTDLWITDIVKVYLYPEKHIKNCEELFPNTKFVNTHAMFGKLAEISFQWFKKELEICNPKLIITLGEVAAKTVSQLQEPQLDGVIRPLEYQRDCNIVHFVHPEFLRIQPNADKSKMTISQLSVLKNEVKKYV
jgi:uracil-DNA glycosylase